MKMRKIRAALFVGILLTALPSIALADLNNGLVAYYPFDGSANDASGNGNNGTVHGAVLTTDRFGKPNSAYHFDGTSSYIQVPDSDSLDLTADFTLGVWLMPRVQTNHAAIFLKHTGEISNDGSWAMFWHHPYGKVSFQATPVFDTNTSSLTAPAAGTWHLALFTFSRASKEWKMDIDGALDNSGTRAYNTGNTSLPLMSVWPETAVF